MAKIILTDRNVSDLASAFSTIHAIVCGNEKANGKTNLPDRFEDCTTVQVKEIHSKSRAMLAEYHESKVEARLRPIREKSDLVVAQFMAEARKAKAAFDAMPENMRSFLPAFPASVKVPLSAFEGCFPAGMNDAEKVRDLRTLYPQVGANSEKATHVNIPFKAEKDAEVKAA